MKNKKTLIAVAALVLVIVVFGAVYTTFGKKTQKGAKVVKIEVYFEESKIEKTFEIITQEEFLGKVLVDEGIVVGEAGPYGLFIKEVQGKLADDTKQEWWCITKNNFEMVETAADTTPIYDGDTFEITLKVGY